MDSDKIEVKVGPSCFYYENAIREDSYTPVHLVKKEEFEKLKSYLVTIKRYCNQLKEEHVEVVNISTILEIVNEALDN